MIRPPPRSTLVPYTTLFRSLKCRETRCRTESRLTVNDMTIASATTTSAPRPLSEVETCLAAFNRYWKQRMQALDEVLEQEERKRSRNACRRSLPRRRRASGRLVRGLTTGDGGPANANDGPLALRAGEVDLPAVIPDDPLDDRQPEAGPLTALLGREERIEDSVDVSGGDPAALIDDG